MKRGVDKVKRFISRFWEGSAPRRIAILVLVGLFLATAAGGGPLLVVMGLSIYLATLVWSTLFKTLSLLWAVPGIGVGRAFRVALWTHLGSTIDIALTGSIVVAVGGLLGVLVEGRVGAVIVALATWVVSGGSELQGRIAVFAVLGWLAAFFPIIVGYEAKLLRVRLQSLSIEPVMSPIRIAALSNAISYLGYAGAMVLLWRHVVTFALLPSR